MNLSNLCWSCELPGHTLSWSWPVSHGPPGRGVSSAPRASQDLRWLPEVQPRTSHHIYGAASLVLLTIFCLPYQQQTNGSLLKEELTATAPTSTSTTTTTTTAAMEVSYCSSLQLQENSFLFDCDLACDAASDPGYMSAGSSLSPTSSVDSFCFSPTTLQTAGKDQNTLDCFIFSNPAMPQLTHETQTLPSPRSSTTSFTTKKSRSRYPGKKRQTASEREKLRMRDLTKAMHHLRTYLPPSVAPAGQTLTKIETLRLTIRYISYLSAQLGITEEELEQRRSSGFVEQPQTLSQFLGQPAACYSSPEPDANTMTAAQMSFLQPSYQVCSYHAHKISYILIV